MPTTAVEASWPILLGQGRKGQCVGLGTLKLEQTSQLSCWVGILMGPS